MPPKQKTVRHNARCVDCAFWLREESATPMQPSVGECRRMPPTVFFDQEHGLGSSWPLTEDADACGEWRARMNA